MWSYKARRSTGILTGISLVWLLLTLFCHSVCSAPPIPHSILFVVFCLKAPDLHKYKDIQKLPLQDAGKNKALEFWYCVRICNCSTYRKYSNKHANFPSFSEMHILFIDTFNQYRHTRIQACVRKDTLSICRLLCIDCDRALKEEGEWSLANPSAVFIFNDGWYENRSSCLQEEPKSFGEVFRVVWNGLAPWNWSWNINKCLPISGWHEKCLTLPFLFFRFVLTYFSWIDQTIVTFLWPQLGCSTLSPPHNPRVNFNNQLICTVLSSAQAFGLSKAQNSLCGCGASLTLEMVGMS